MSADPQTVGLVALGNRQGDAAQRLRAHLTSRMGQMRTDRESWRAHWSDLAHHMLPRRSPWLPVPNAVRGQEITAQILDTTGSRAARTLASGMMAGVTSPLAPWFRLSIPNMDLQDSSPVKLWLDEAQRRMLSVMANSNYYTAKATQYFDLSVFGTAPLVITEDAARVFRCTVPTPGEYFCANGETMEVDSLYREFAMSNAQLVQRFGIDAVPEAVAEQYRLGGGAVGREWTVCHAIEPNDGLTAGQLVAKRFAWREVYWIDASGQLGVLQARGYEEKPFSCPRWDLSGNDAYGRSPGMEALAHVRQLQHETLRKAEFIDKLVQPPMVGDIALRNEPASLIPGGITYANLTGGGPGFQPAIKVEPAGLQPLLGDIADVRQQVEKIFFNDLFLMISQLDTVRTATEIDARREEKLIQLGPVLERNQNESLDPEVDRIFAIMVRRGLLPPPPPEIGGAPLQVQYVSMLAQAQRAASTAAIERLAQFVGNLAGADPQALDNLDVDEVIDTYADALGVSPKVVRATSAVAQLRQQRNQQAAEQQGMQQSMAAAQGAQVLSKTDVGGGQNALQAILQGAQPSQQRAA